MPRARPTARQLSRIEDLRPQERNANRHGPRGMSMLETSMRDDGYLSPLTVAADGEAIDGSARLEMSAEVFGDAEPIFVRSDGKRPIVHVREDIPNARDPRAVRLSTAANRIGQVNLDWDPEVLLALKEEGALVGLFTAEELEVVLAGLEKPAGDGGDEFVDPGGPARSELGTLWALGENHRLLVGDAECEADVARLLAGAVPRLMITDPPYGVEYDPTWRDAVEGHGKSTMRTKVKNDDRVEWTSAYRLFPGDVAYVWHAGIYAADVGLNLAACAFQIRAQIIWSKQNFTLSRGAYHWKHEPCQPAGTMVRTPSGEVPIEQLVDGDRVVSYDSNSSQITGLRDGRPIQAGSRQYDGDLYQVAAAGLQTRATDGHQFTVRFDAAAADTWCSYLMRKGGWWRVGIARLFNSRGFGLSVRLLQEDGDEAWILATHANKVEAGCAEQVFSCKYGIPTTHWATDRNARGPSLFRSVQQIAEIYARLDLESMHFAAHRLLYDHGRRPEYPLVTSDSTRHSRRTTARLRACNLIPGLMQLPVPTPGDPGRRGATVRDVFTWEGINAVERTPFSGPVYQEAPQCSSHTASVGWW